MAEYAGLSLRDIYRLKCEELRIRKNSKLMRELPSTPDCFDEPVRLDMSGNFVGPRGLTAVLEVIKMSLALRQLDLRDNQLTNQSVLDLADVAQGHKSLACIDLSDNPITIGAGKALLDLARANPRIEEISLGNTGIREMLLRAIDTQLQKNRTQVRLNKERLEQSIVPQQHDASAELSAVQLRQVLADVPSTVHEHLFDDDPTDRVLAACARHGAVFVDPQFPPELASVQKSVLQDYDVARWARAGDIIPSRRLFSDSVTIDHVALGAAKDGWLFAAVEAVSRAGQRLESLIYPRQWSPCGAYSVKLFIDGQWRWMLVDDSFPVDSDGKPVFAHTRDKAPAALWPMLIEKAVAKLHGSYQALDDSVASTHPQEKPHSCALSMMDLTGGVGISRDLHQEAFDAEGWWPELLELHAKRALMAATIGGRERTAVEEAGLSPYSAYTILSVRSINGFHLLRLRLPFGDSRWVGEWGDDSILWDQYEDVKAALDFKNKNDGSFWMPYALFLRYFGTVHITKTFDHWHNTLVQGEWSQRSAGGPFFEETWMHNPRYKFTLMKTGEVFLNLSIRDSRCTVSLVDTIAFHVIKADYFPMRYDKDNVIVKTSYLITNSVSFEGDMEAGTYWLIPSTYVAGRHSPFNIRMLAESAFTIQQEHEDKYWKGVALKSHWQAAGEYQSGEDHPQFELTIPPQPDAARVLLSLTVDESDEHCVCLFVCAGDGSGRVLGAIDDDKVLIKSKYLISNTVQLQCELPGGDAPYVVVPCLQPEGSRSVCTLKCWCSAPKFGVKELPMWGRKQVQGEWESSSTYQGAVSNPQFELVCPTPLQRFVIKLEVDGCSDPSIVFFVVSNDGRQGRGLGGLIPEQDIAGTSTYIRADSVAKDFQLPARPADSYLIVPNLQPPGSKGVCRVTVSCPSADFQLHNILD